MKCDQARHALLDANPEQLSPDDDGPLGTHLRTCVACSAAAATILESTDMMRSSMRDVVAARSGAPRSDGTRSIAAAEEGATILTRSDGDVVALDVRSRRSRSTLIRARSLIPLAAAVLAGLWLFNPESASVDLHLPLPDVPETPVVNAGGAAGVAVMRTADPMITVVWTF